MNYQISVRSPQWEYLTSFSLRRFPRYCHMHHDTIFLKCNHQNFRQ